MPKTIIKTAGEKKKGSPGLRGRPAPTLNARLVPEELRRIRDRRCLPKEKALEVVEFSTQLNDLHDGVEKGRRGRRRVSVLAKGPS